MEKKTYHNLKLCWNAQILVMMFKQISLKWHQTGNFQLIWNPLRILPSSVSNHGEHTNRTLALPKRNGCHVDKYHNFQHQAQNDHGLGQPPPAVAVVATGESKTSREETATIPLQQSASDWAHSLIAADSTQSSSTCCANPSRNPNLDCKFPLGKTEHKPRGYLKNHPPLCDAKSFCSTSPHHQSGWCINLCCPIQSGRERLVHWLSEVIAKRATATSHDNDAYHTCSLDKLATDGPWVHHSTGTD